MYPPPTPPPTLSPVTPRSRPVSSRGRRHPPPTPPKSQSPKSFQLNTSNRTCTQLASNKQHRRSDSARACCPTHAARGHPPPPLAPSPFSCPSPLPPPTPPVPLPRRPRVSDKIKKTYVSHSENQPAKQRRTQHSARTRIPQCSNIQSIAPHIAKFSAQHAVPVDRRGPWRPLLAIGA